MCIRDSTYTVSKGQIDKNLPPARNKASIPNPPPTMSSPTKLKTSRKRPHSNITSPLRDNGISNLNDAVEKDEAKLAHGDTIKEAIKKNEAIDEKDENYSDGTM